MATSTAPEKEQITTFANYAYEQQKETVVAELVERIQESIKVGEEQIVNGQFMTLADSQTRINKKLFNK
ncbi:MAG: hypothetical protein OFPII_06610 [Osedax symbiont Rs1]|nr:MAG: hypothetical protein OFPII_06610 [Osedax symbiont Rs1]